MASAGRVGELWRHPVKSLAGERVTAVVVGAAGVVGDRAWAVRDLATGAVLSAKREPRLLLLAAHAAGEGVAISSPGGEPVAGADADRLLCDWLGREVRLELAGQEPGDAAGPRGFVDEAHLHLLAAAELGGWDPRRFRANVVIDGVGCLDDLVGERVRIGGVVVEVDKRTKRCAMPTMAQPAGVGPAIAKDVGVLRVLARDRDLRLGVYAHVVTPGRIDRGARIALA